MTLLMLRKTPQIATTSMMNPSSNISDIDLIIVVSGLSVQLGVLCSTPEEKKTNVFDIQVIRLHLLHNNLLRETFK